MNAHRRRNIEQQNATRARRRAIDQQPPQHDHEQPIEQLEHRPPAPATLHVALTPANQLNGLDKHSLGDRTRTCAACNAKLWRKEVKQNGMGGVLCCNYGKSCSLAGIFPQPFPEPLESFFVSEAPNNAARSFRKNTRAYGSAFSMASSRVHLPEVQGVSMIRIRGAVHHLFGPLQPGPGQAPKFAQLYIIDNANEQIQARMAALGGEDGGLDQDVLRETYCHEIDSKAIGGEGCHRG